MEAPPPGCFHFSFPRTVKCHIGSHSPMPCIHVPEFNVALHSDSSTCSRFEPRLHEAPISTSLWIATRIHAQPAHAATHVKPSHEPPQAGAPFFIADSPFSKHSIFHHVHPFFSLILCYANILYILYTIYLLATDAAQPLPEKSPFWNNSLDFLAFGSIIQRR